MFPGREEARLALTGAWQLFLSRPDGMRYFDLGVEGFWRSFRAIWLTLPAYFLAALLEFQRLSAGPIGGSAPLAEPPPNALAYIAEKIAALGIDWLALPIVLALLAPRLKISATYPSFIIARNWSTVLASVPFGVLALLSLTGMIGDDATSFLWLIALAVLLRYNFIVARIALGASIGFALAVVVGDFALSLLIATGIGSLFGIAASLQ